MFQRIEVQNEFLKSYIDYIHCFKTDEPFFKRQLIIFPNVGSAISFYFNTAFEELSSQRFVSRHVPGRKGVIGHINRIDPVEILDTGSQDRITFVFKPLGLNYFILHSLGELINDQNPSKILISSNDNRYSELMSTLDSVSTVHERAKLIEQFFISIYKQFDDSLIREVLNNFTFHEKLSTIAKRSATTTKTMDRLFNAHIGITPVQFKNILQFRNSLRTKLNNMKQSLASLSFESHYNDLPYMLRVYRKFTGMTGTAFFNSLSTSADGKYLYREVS